MANVISEVPPVLTCWKDIAQYLGKGVRTVQRWEQELGLPVRRPNGIEHKSPVAAHPADLDAWLETHWSARNGKKATNQNGCQQVASLPLSVVIQNSQQLRLAHMALLHETTKALQELVRSCFELHETQTSPSPAGK